MSSEDTAASDGKTAQTVGQLVKYSRELNQSDTVGEVGTYALEATFHVMDGHPAPTVFEVTDGEIRVLESMAPDLTTGETGGPLARRALDGGQTVIVPDDDVAIGYDGDDVTVVSPDDVAGTVPSALAMATPSLGTDESGTSGVILQVEWDAIDAVDAHHVKPVEYLGDHVATAVANIRSRERLERARNDLARRKEMIEMYDRILRHDLGNDLQVITGFSQTLSSAIDEEHEQIAEYADKINRTAKSAADLVGRVGDLVKTLEQETEPSPRDLAPILSSVVADVDTKFETLSIEYDPADVEATVYAGDLLDSVFTNVLSNAAVHNDDPVTVTVSTTEPTPNAVTVGFADDGTGVADAVRDDIFEIGRKGPESDGTGFGLGIARALVESYGGTVAVGESDEGGAEFRITLERA